MRRVAVLVFVVACTQPHYTFAPPAPDLTPEQRVDAYSHLVGTKEHWISQNGSMVQHSIILQDGREIFYPEDLAPLVAPDSKTATHGRRAESARASAFHWSLAGFGMMLAGAIVVGETFDSSPVGEKIGIGLVLAGLVAAGGVGTYFRFKTTDETHDAYEAFDDDLATRLNVCVAALQFVPCESAPPQKPPTVYPAR